MKNLIPVNSLFLYVFIICVVAISEAFAIKPTTTQFQPTTGQHKIQLQKSTALPLMQSPMKLTIDDSNPVVSDADSVDFDVEVIQPRKFLLSFTKKRGETFFIKIYDVIGNLIHHEVVSKTGIFRKHYDLSKYKTDLYVIEVGSSKKAKIKRLFLG
jgi:hypothetical protein